jgi:arabinose-5-phosphate isomerase
MTDLTRSYDHVLSSALRTVEIEQDAIAALARAVQQPSLCAGLTAAVRSIREAPGRVIVTGLGKSGIVARKIAATLTSTGTAAHFLHPTEASHGDLGVISADDVVLAISWSGETSELRDIIDYCRRFGVTLIVMTSDENSSAARAATICLTLPAVREACPYSLAPTSSTTIQTVLGDVLAVALVERSGFSRSDFHAVHPGGRLGYQLASVGQLMGTGDEMPIVSIETTIKQATIEMSLKRYGCTGVIDQTGALVGVFTDGDLRRCYGADHFDDAIGEHMTRHPIIVVPSMLASDALMLMNSEAVTTLFVCEDDHLRGILHIHDVVRVGAA